MLDSDTSQQIHRHERHLGRDGGSQHKIKLALVVVEKKIEVAPVDGLRHQQGQLPRQPKIRCRSADMENRWRTVENAWKTLGKQMENNGKQNLFSGTFSGEEMPRRKTIGKTLHE